ncbi:hypothetical protein QJS83_11805 [Bdellovibrio sp. 22V]|uniref:hypothetical protein n=1 Tax=Bdellovibrio sp. 22V TaxID=3044166 RepID=UPI0025433303|nr:hypothetical protein [Bdellovibrio sp. 22V]WII71145.1 hypothetical protein QJS83_11805 [Bdellovibrio sp. 22V]
MNWKGAFKIVSVSFFVLSATFVGLIVWGLSRLPSAFEIKKSLTPPALAAADRNAGDRKVSRMKTNPLMKGAVAQAAESAKGPSKKSSEPPIPQNQIVMDTTKVLLEDFVDSRKPLVTGCRHLEKASQSDLLRDPESASSKYFFHSLAQEEKDPLVETAAPILRYVFRAPGMQSVVDMIVRAEEAQDLSLLKKAEFYYEIYRAGDFLKGHIADMDVILQKSYNMHYLTRAIAQRPELAREPAALSFCEQMEKNLNTNGVYNADVAAQEMMKFLSAAGVDPRSIGYDPHYRSQVKLDLSNSQVMLNDTWVVRLFARDFYRAQRQPAGGGN